MHETVHKTLQTAITEFAQKVVKNFFAGDI
jgi:hypothetical protein